MSAAFRRFDSNGNGALSMPEFLEGVKMLNDWPSSLDPRRLFQLLDKEKAGRL